MKKKKLIIAGFILLVFILFIVSVLIYARNIHNLRQLDPLELESMTKETIIQQIYERQSASMPIYYLIPLFGFFGVLVGSIVYYIMNDGLEKKEKIIYHNSEIILQLLGVEEKKVIKKIIDNNGKITQAEISYMDGFTKVKAHRLVELLVQKGILEKDKVGKMRIIRMNKDLYEILKAK